MGLSGGLSSNGGGQSNSVVATAFTMAGAAAPNGFVKNPVTFNSVIDPIWQIGYNIPSMPGVVGAEPSWFLGIEGAYKLANGPDEGWSAGAHLINEFYINYNSPDQSTVTSFRPIYVGALRDSNSSHASHVIIDIGTAGFPDSQFEVQASSANQVFTINDGGVFVNTGKTLKVGGVSVKLVPATQITRKLIDGNNQFTSTRTANTMYYAAINVAEAGTITGITCYNGGTASGNLLVALYDSAGTQLAVSNSTAQTGTFSVQFIPFTGTYSAAIGKYHVAITPSSSTATFNLVDVPGSAAASAQGSFIVAASITPPAINATTQMPQLGIY